MGLLCFKGARHGNQEGEEQISCEFEVNHFINMIIMLSVVLIVLPDSFLYNLKANISLF